MTAWLMATAICGQAGGIRSVADVEKAIEGTLTAETARAVENYFRRTQPNGADLTRGATRPPVARGKILWFIEAPANAKTAVVTKTGDKWALKPVDGTAFHAVVVPTPAIVEYRFQYNLDGNAVGRGVVQIENYDLPPDCLPKEGVPKGEVVKMPPFVSTNAYPGWSHEWWMYLPPPQHLKEPPALMVFLDGKSYIDGDCPTPAVFDNLIHQKKMPACVGVFVNPGSNAGMNPSGSRSDEYDTCTPRFAEFLEKELLPEATKKAGFSADPKRRAICGASSGGSGSFTAAWHRPDLFSRVLSQIGSFCDFRSIESYPSFDGKIRPDTERFQTWKVAHDYPALIRKTKPAKPLRVFLQEGERDLDNQLGNWPLANRQMDSALEFAGYRHKLVMGSGFHNRKYGRAILPESLVWLWSDD
jgi:enterochelin esterase family protein